MNIGARLRTEREARGLSIAAVSEVTRIHLRFLAAIENNDAQAIPPRPYGRGFVRAYAAYLGDDPEQTVRDFFAQLAPKPASPAPETPAAVQLEQSPAHNRRWRGVAALAVMCLLVAALLVPASRALLRHQNPEAGAIATSGSSAPAVAGTGGTAEPAAPPAARPPGVTIQLEASGPAWVTASVDGRRAIYRTMLAGERETLSGERDVFVRVGDAGAVRWQVNGRPPVAMGFPGQVRSARVTVDNATTLR